MTTSTSSALPFTRPSSVIGGDRTGPDHHPDSSIPLKAMHRQDSDLVQWTPAVPTGDAPSVCAAAPVTASEGDAPTDGAARLDRLALLCLAVQHTSSSWGYRSAEFAFPLYFAYLFPGTLLPASIYGLCLLVASLLLSPSVGRYIDTHKTGRLALVRSFIVVQKVTVACSYAGFSLLLNLGGAEISHQRKWAAFVGLTFIGTLIVLSGTALTIAIERDWVTTIARGQQDNLTKLNTIIRQIDLLSKLLAPMFVSLLTTVSSYRISAFILLAINCFTFTFEWIWIGTVYKRFTEIKKDEERERAKREVMRREEQTDEVEGAGMQVTRRRRRRQRRCLELLLSPRRMYQLTAIKGKALHRDLRTFAALSTFPTSISLALLYTSVLSFDSTFLTYLKQPHPSALSASSTSNGILKVVPNVVDGGSPSIYYTDAFISGMRGICVAMGLAGTILMPILSKRFGLVRVGSWSLYQEFISLTPTVIALWMGVGLRWNTACLFVGMALSRIGLWSYDLTQLALLQQALYEHASASLHFGIQASLLNAFDISHFLLTLIWNRPRDFNRPASISWALVGVAWVVYVGWYARKERGHVVHLEWVGMGDGGKKKTKGEQREEEEQQQQQQQQEGAASRDPR